MNEGWTFAFGARNCKSMTCQHCSAWLWADLCTMTWQQETRDWLHDNSWMVYWLGNALSAWSQKNHTVLLVTTSLSKKTKRNYVALLKLRMDCRCHKLSPFFCQFLSAVSESEKDCRHIFEQCHLSPKPLGRPLYKGYTQNLSFTNLPQKLIYLSWSSSSTKY